MMIDGNDGAHRYGGGCDSIRKGTPASGREPTKRRPERIILRHPTFSKYKINKTRVINLVFLVELLSTVFCR